MGKKILVVDDEQDVVTFLTTLLEDNGYSVRSASNGLEAMEAVTQEKPDLILLDLEMPQETGTGFFRKIRNKKEYQDIPIIVASGVPGRRVAVSKSVVVIDKPFEEQRVLDEVEKALGE